MIVRLITYTRKTGCQLKYGKFEKYLKKSPGNLDMQITGGMLKISLSRFLFKGDL